MRGAVKAVADQLVEEGLAEHRQGQKQQQMAAEPLRILPQMAEALGQQEAIDGKSKAAQGPHPMVDLIADRPVTIEDDAQMIRQHQ